MAGGLYNFCPPRVPIYLRLDDLDYVNTSTHSSQSGWMLDKLFNRKFQGNFNGMHNGMINGMESFTKASTGSFTGALMGKEGYGEGRCPANGKGKRGGGIGMERRKMQVSIGEKRGT